MKLTSIAAVALLVVAGTARAGEKPMDAGTLAHAVDRLANTARVLYVAAHPDDENTRLLAYLANQRHVTTAYLSLTRGSGGQNLIGSEQGELLGVIRTEELLAARRLDAAEQRFTRMRDFGYSKSADETLNIWGRDAAIADVVWVIRSFRPDVIITRFDEQPPNHGHHTASAILAREAFAAAADPERFPEQLERGVTVWQAERLLHNLSTWRPVTIPDDALAVDVGSYDPRLGVSWGELAATSRSQHKSQGFGRAGERGPVIEHLVPVAGSVPRADLLEGIDSTWARFGADARPLVAAIVAARGSLERDRPEAALPALLAVRAGLAALPDEPRVRDARTATDSLIAASIGLFARANADRDSAVPGSSVAVELELVARRPSDGTLVAVTFADNPRRVVAEPLTPEKVFRLDAEVMVPEDASVSAPYWLASLPEAGRYVVDDDAAIDRPRAHAALAVQVDLRFGEHEITIETPVVHAWTDRVHGERQRRFLVAPPVSVTPLRTAVLAANRGAAQLDLRLRAAVDDVRGRIEVPVPEGWSVEPEARTFALASRGDEVVVRFAVTGPSGRARTELRPRAVVGERAWSWAERVIDYPHIPVQQVFQPATAQVATLEITRGEGRIGYLAGSGDTVADDLMHVGYDVEQIDDATLRTGDLDRFAAIVVGIRAYNTRAALPAAHARLMAYVERGGTVVMQYNTSSSWSPLETAIGPYPLTLGRTRVTDETAAMEAVDPDSPWLHYPNAIVAADFDGWVQERGLYFAEEWDQRYQPLFAANDPGEEPARGGVLVAGHGEGRYVYTGLAFFRQLPAGVPGAYRLLANLLAGGRDAP